MAEKKVIELEVKTEGVVNLKAELRKAQQEVIALSEKFGATSQEAVNAAKRAAELKDAIGDAKALTDAFNPDAKFNALSSSIGGVLNGFQAYEGALGLIGVESEALQETMLKVQSAMALSQGLQGVLEAKDSFKQLGAVVKNAFGTMTTASKAFIATGVGLAIAAIAYAINEMSEASEQAAKEVENLEKATENLNDELEFSSKQLSDYSRKAVADAKLRGATDKELLEAELNASQKSIEQRWKNTNERIKANNRILNNENASAEQIKKANAEIYKAQREQIEIKREASVLSSEFALKEKELADAEIAKNKERAKAAADAAKERNQKLKEERERLQKEAFEAEQKANEERLQHQEEVYNLELSLMKDTRQKEIQELINSYDEKYELANGNAELEKQLTETLNSEIATINKKYADEEAAKKEALRKKELDNERGFLEARITLNAKDYEAKLELLELNRQAELSNKELTEGEIAAIEAKYAEQRKKISDEEKEHKKRNQDLTLQAATTTLDTIGNIAQLFAGKSEKQQKKAFNIQKAASIANATIQTYQSATSAFSALSPIPIVGPVLGAIAAAGAVTAGLLNIKKIASTKFEGGGAPSGGGGGGGGAGAGASATSGGAVTPQFNVVGNAQATNPLAGLGNQPIQAYVVSGEVTTAQQLDNNKITYATFG